MCVPFKSNKIDKKQRTGSQREFGVVALVSPASGPYHGMDRNAGRELTTDSVLRDHAEITSHLATWPRGAGTRACRATPHRDGRRTCTRARPDESGRGRLRVRATSALKRRVH